MKKALNKAERALLEARLQTRRGSDSVWAFTRELQEELWRRKYGHSWGTRSEFEALIRRHPELMELDVAAAADVILANLSAWDETLAAKEAKAKKNYVSPEQVAEWEREKAGRRNAIVEKHGVQNGAFAVSIARLSDPYDGWGLMLDEDVLTTGFTRDQALAQAEAFGTGGISAVTDLCAQQRGTIAD